MKNLIAITVLAVSITLISCNSEQKHSSDTVSSTANSHDHSKSNDSSLVAIDLIIDNYLEVKNALVNDNADEAASSGKKLFMSFEKINAEKLNEKQKSELADIVETAKENAEHIGNNAGKIDHQREHFVLLSKDVQDLLELFGSNKKLFLDFCPMADGGNGAFWLSEIKEIKNPYYGSAMLECGSVKKEY